ncbi:cold-responsive protein kinase 1-like [Aristolochia californica]|uniref:cold-responsive protein kinase 1-like n=1 Tax=Aristolochia californica TaxID=171875 RepID=UPI0035D9ABE1
MSFCCFSASAAGRGHPSQQDIDGSKNVMLFSYNELRAATKNFHASNKIGQGGFGTVYKGTLKNGRQVAVKALSTESRQGIQEFLTEIDVITNVKHPNLVELVGCCVQGNNRILVYEYVENNSLDRALLGSKDKKLKLDWHNRSSVCMAVASGLVFLHEELDPHIVHRDIKASNILLDKNLLPKIGDFGLAKLFPNNVTHLSTRVAGTTGYLAPEYAMRGQLTKKADIYSFGVLILEIVSGRSSAKSTRLGVQKFLLEWVWQLYEEGNLIELVDPELEKPYPEEEVLRFMKVALFCTQAAAKKRPNMTQVLAMLSKQRRLNEKLLTPPGIIQDMMAIGRGGLEKTNTDDLQTPQKTSPCLSSQQSSAQASSAPITVTEMLPR